MDKLAGMLIPSLQELPRIQTRLTVLYLEHCRLSRDSNAVTIMDKDGIVCMPAAIVNAVLLGPGTSITHQAVTLMGDAGITIIWVGEQGVRYYAAGRPMTHSSAMLTRQAEMFSNTRLHMQVARRMYQLRFPDEDVSGLTMQQLRGREGSRIRQTYRRCARESGVPWNGRDYDPDDFSGSDDVNKALSAANACLYGLAHAVIVALGCSAGLGFVHVGHENSFVYDIADLYKAEITIPLAFEIASEHVDDVGRESRKRMRERMQNAHVLERMVADIHYLLGDNNIDIMAQDEVSLWNGTKDLVRNGVNYGKPEVGDWS